ncbi:MAG: NUDIX domain-containing protein [Defluviitaleaceae bacterium]|nr:NUDIX domain-containing protein [Defluviitaleaceae bacterium]
MEDIRFLIDRHFFTYRVGAVIIEDDYLLMVKNTSVDYYYSVGGAVQHMETAQEAVRREVLEETGVDYEVDRLLFIHENIFNNANDTPMLKDRDCHEIALYFLMKPQGSRDVVCKSVGMDGAKESLHWLPVGELGEYVMYPKFFCDRILDLPLAVEYVCTDRVQPKFT